MAKIVVRHGEGPPWRGDSIRATENAGFSATETWARFCNKTAQIIANTSTSIQLSVSDMLTRVNFTTFAMADPRCGRLIADSLIQMAPRREHSNSGKKCIDSIRFDSAI